MPTIPREADDGDRADRRAAQVRKARAAAATPEAVEVDKKARRRREGIIAAVGPGISNGRVEPINNKIKVTAGMGYGFGNTDNMIALPMLRCSDAKPELPGRPPEKGKEHRPMKAAA